MGYKFVIAVLVFEDLCADANQPWHLGMKTSKTDTPKIHTNDSEGKSCFLGQATLPHKVEGVKDSLILSSISSLLSTRGYKQ